MANPKRKHSHSRSAKRRGTWKTEMPNLTLTQRGSKLTGSLPHTATPDGFYKGRRLPGFRDRRG